MSNPGIPFHRVYFDNREIKEVLQAIRSGWWTMGPKTVEFEKKFARYVDAKYAIAVNSCTAALHLALEAIGLQPGDEVILPAMTFTATAEVVCYFKAKPVLADVQDSTLNIDPQAIEKAITKRTKAIITVDYAGQPADYREIQLIAKKYKLFLIADAAHTLPSKYRNTMVGSLADITCFSFYATKTLSTGEGGMITTNNRKWSDRMKIMRLHGMNRDAWKRYTREGTWYYEIVDAGYKYNMTDIQAALGIAQLEKIDTMWKKRRRIAETYLDAFARLPEITIPEVKADRTTSWHLFVIKLNTGRLSIDRNRFIEELSSKGISASVHFIPLYRHPFYRDTFGYRSTSFRASERAYQRIISLPIYPSMTGTEVSRVISAVTSIARRFKKKHV